MRVIFMGTPEFSAPVLQALVDAGHDIPCVYCQPPRSAGRGKKERPTPVHKRAFELGLQVRHPINLKSEVDRQAFAELNADVAVVVAYGLLLPQTILDAPKHGCLNIHASLLPRWRGAAPIHRAIMAGDAETGICIMQMEAGLDTGPVLAREVTPIQDQDTTQSLHDRLSAIGSNLIVRSLEQLTDLQAEPQSVEGVTYATKIDKSEALIDWSQPAAMIDRQIRGLSQFPGAWTLYKGERLKLLSSCVASGSGKPGIVLNDALTVACGEGAVQVTRLQRAGKGAMDVVELLRGWAIPPGSVLGE